MWKSGSTVLLYHAEQGKGKKKGRLKHGTLASIGCFCYFSARRSRGTVAAGIWVAAVGASSATTAIAVDTVYSTQVLAAASLQRERDFTDGTRILDAKVLGFFVLSQGPARRERLVAHVTLDVRVVGVRDACVSVEALAIFVRFVWTHGTRKSWSAVGRRRWDVLTTGW